MINPNKGTSEDVLSRLKLASKERMLIEIKDTIDTHLKEFKMSWDDLARLLGMPEQNARKESRSLILMRRILNGKFTVNDLNTIAHLFSAEPYIIFRPRFPWTNS